MTNNVAMQIRLDEFLPPPSLFITGIMEATTFIHICTCRIQCLLVWNRGQMARLTSEILEILPYFLIIFHKLARAFSKRGGFSLEICDLTSPSQFLRRSNLPPGALDPAKGRGGVKVMRMQGSIPRFEARLDPRLSVLRDRPVKMTLESTWVYPATHLSFRSLRFFLFFFFFSIVIEEEAFEQELCAITM